MAQPLPPMTSATGMGPLPEFLADLGGREAIHRVFERADLPVALIEMRQTRLPMSALVRLFAEATDVAGDPLFGLRVGFAMEPEDYGLWMRYGLGALTLRTAIARLSCTMALHQSGPAITLGGTGDIFVWRYVPPPFPGLDAAHHADHVVPTMLKFARRYLGADWTPAWIEVPYVRDPYAGSREEKTSTDWRFGGAGIGLPLTREELTRPRPIAPDPASMSITLRDVRAAMRNRPPTFATAVGDLISLALLEGRTDMDTVAARLDLPVRTLQRRLSEDGTTYRWVLDGVRRTRAAELSAGGGLRIARIATVLGYADPSNYRRAARRWTD
ncbi:AraC family transcriptional regulator [Amorphus orientalis]|uniref:AraC-like DNA-binding protein n=1 Tax=Amorphus orientalis TaxID=649198 RepID=A0AAE4AUI0_9HYPH|nr:AraC family transcriptional regulator [Amorphus orientalis]MDQ0317430.1 AraC-like DNA-binding protein [Amorphus orientalis]